MRRVLKWIGIVIGGLLGLVILALAVTYIIAGQKLNDTYEITVDPIAIPDEPSVNRDEWPLLIIELCEGCHGADLSGEVFEDDPLFGYFASSNLTAGEGGIGRTYSDTDYIRALRHGVSPDGKPLLLMPSQLFTKYSDEDLAEIIAYVKNVPPVDNEHDETRLGPLGRAVLVFNLFPDLLPVETIDHDASREKPEPGLTVDYGEYLALVCVDCHAEDLAGGPEAGEGMNLTPGGQLAEWSEEDFIRTMRTGVAPDGEMLDEDDMPWPTFAKMTDTELRAIWLYLLSLPAVETEHR
jgi:mono/diheme cytochrome c family protein